MCHTGAYWFLVTWGSADTLLCVGKGLATQNFFQKSMKNSGKIHNVSGCAQSIEGTGCHNRFPAPEISSRKVTQESATCSIRSKMLTKCVASYENTPRNAVKQCHTRNMNDPTAFVQFFETLITCVLLALSQRNVHTPLSPRTLLHYLNQVLHKSCAFSAAQRKSGHWYRHHRQQLSGRLLL